MAQITIDDEIIRNFTAIFEEPLNEAGPHFTCDEAEIMAAMLRALGSGDAAETWLVSHATGDDEIEGDSHYLADGELRYRVPSGV